MGSKTIIEHDLFNITKRLKAIDRGYFVVYNHKNNKFEVHNKYQPIDTYCVTCPYKTLDKRLIDYVLITSLDKNIDLIEKMEKHNELLNQEYESKQKDYIDINIKEIYDVVKNSTRDYDIKNSLKQKWM